MIIFVENRPLVIDAYRNQFQQAGVAITGLSSVEFDEWMSTCDQLEIAPVEAFLVGDTQCPSSDVRRIRKLSNVPTLALVETRRLDSTLEYFEAGFDDVVSKPVHTRELLVRIGAIQKRAARAQRGASEKRLNIYFDGRAPEIDRKPIVLPRRERRILEYLVSINGRRATKSQIFSAVYGMFDESVEENVVESHISKLRKKLRARLGYDPIESKRYLGYRFITDALERAPDKVAMTAERSREAA